MAQLRYRQSGFPAGAVVCRGSPFGSEPEARATREPQQQGEHQEPYPALPHKSPADCYPLTGKRRMDGSFSASSPDHASIPSSH